MADSTLTAIRTKVRKLTLSPSTAQIPNTAIDEYINTFVLYDFPEYLRTFLLRTQVTFYLQPHQDSYDTSIAPIGDPLDNFKNKYVTTHRPCYIAGYEALFSQSKDQFYNLYPLTNTMVDIATGDGVITNFTGTLSSIPVMKNNVSFVSRQVNGDKLVLYDNGLGSLLGNGIGVNTINYETGAYVLNFSNAPANSEAITAMTIPYTASRPQACLYFDGKFYFRPVPDKAYPVTLDVNSIPTELLNVAQSPDLEEWWQYIAYGAALKIFQDRMDMDSVQAIMPEFQNQELLIGRRTIVQQSDQRGATIYTGLGIRNDFNNNYY